MINLKVQRVVDSNWETVEYVNIDEYSTDTIAKELKEIVSYYKSIGQKVSMILKKGYELPKGLFINENVKLDSGDHSIWFSNNTSATALLARLRSTVQN